MNVQDAIFRWAAVQPALVGLVIFGAGTAYAFFGCYLYPALLAVSCGLIGWIGGGLGAEALQAPHDVVGIVAGVVFAGMAIGWQKPMTALASTVTWGLLAHYLTYQFRVPPMGVLIAAGLFAALGLTLSVLCFRTMRVVLTVLHGAALLVVGFVSLSSQLLPSLGSTFRGIASSEAFVVPMLMGMVVAAAYSYQAMCQQGGIRTGT
ncbi:hypothetical protein RAS1_06160 [Phycisphaerae bacterium RAS1]|nr:hypothetical protein RAS1_06160 [Phycisphaerae bacterium RAS1]